MSRESGEIVQYSLPVLCEGGAFGTLFVRTGGGGRCTVVWKVCFLF